MQMQNLMSERQDLKVVFFGDSITEGQYVDPSTRWTEIVTEMLRSHFAQTARIHAFNKGVSGHTTRQGLERYPADVQAIVPDLLTIQFGLNDGNCWQTDRGCHRVSPAAFHANLVEMIDRARLFGVRDIVISTNHRTLRNDPMVSGKSLEHSNVAYNEIVRDVAAQAGVDLFDVGEVFHLGQDLEKLLLPAPDVLHLSELGHQHYASLIFEPLREKLDGLLFQEPSRKRA